MRSIMVQKNILPFIITGLVVIGFSPTLLNAHSWMAPKHEATQRDPRPADQQSIQSGQALFVESCAQCHGADGLGLPATTTQLGSDTPNLPQRLKSHTDGDFHWKIRTGRGEMPAFEKDLSADEIWDIIHFIRSQPN